MYSMVYKGIEYDINIGDVHNRLTITKLYKKKSKLYCDCLCECGNTRNGVLVRSLYTGNTKSCGCYNKELTIIRNTTHNQSKTRLYKIWQGMIRRCNNPNRKDHKHYHSKGVTVCDEWYDFQIFQEWANSNGYSDELTIERIDNSKGYNPYNCTWIPKSQQSKNRTNLHMITYEGETLTLTDTALKYNIKRVTLTNKLRKGESIDSIIKKSIHKRATD